MSSGIKLIVGLGNPGPEYAKTRHNAGAWFVESLCNDADATLKHSAKFHGLHADVCLQKNDCHLLIPATFMNLSGRSVQAVMNFYKIAPNEVLIAHDEIDLPVGDIRLKFAGGHGGHNGLRDIIKLLDSNEFYRLRIGVGHPGPKKNVEDYVLKAPNKTEREIISSMLVKAETVLPQLLAGEFQPAMMALHTKTN